jgi:hypothetical protein
MITAIKEIDGQTILVETSGGITEALFIKTILGGLGEAREPAGFPDGFRVLVKATTSDGLRSWEVRDRLAQEQSIEIHEDVDRRVERERQRRE